MIKLKTLLPEDINNTNIDLPANEFELSSLSFDTVINNFPADYKDIQFNRMQPDGKEGPYYSDSVAFPNANDSSTKIGDLKSFEDWKKESLRKFGNDTKILLDPDAVWFDKVKVKSDEFDTQKDAADTAKASMLKQWGTTT